MLSLPCGLSERTPGSSELADVRMWGDADRRARICGVTPDGRVDIRTVSDRRGTPTGTESM